LFLSLVAVAWLGNSARAQSALDGFDPNPNGSVEIVVVQPDGKILIGGTFTILAPNGGAPVTRQPHRPIESGRHARHRFQSECEQYRL
jgi:hypothetical protein